MSDLGGVLHGLRINSYHEAADLIEQLQQRIAELESQMKERDEQRWFTYCEDDGYFEHDSEEAAKSYGDKLVKDWLDTHTGWAEEVTSVRMGVVTHQATESERIYREGNVDEDGCDESGLWWDEEWEYMSNWTLEELPQLQKEQSK